MPKSIQAYEALDGTLHKEYSKALEADNEFLRQQNEELRSRVPREEPSMSSYGSSGGGGHD